MKLGVIGGTGLYDISGLKNVEPVDVETPFGPPSDSYMRAEFAGREVYFLPRHGRGHTLLPSELNHRANIYGFKKLGVDEIIGVSAVGSLHEDRRPGDIVLPDQYFDRTKASARHTFFGNGVVAHIAFADPTCARLRGVIREMATKATEQYGKARHVRIHDGGTYVNMEGPAFSTRAESNVYRQLGFHVIGMTSLAEAKLCREAEICYACMAMVTDYDCWKEQEDVVSLEVILKVLNANSELAAYLVKQIIEALPGTGDCPCRHALENSIITSADLIPEKAKKDLAPIIGKYCS